MEPAHNKTTEIELRTVWAAKTELRTVKAATMASRQWQWRQQLSRALTAQQVSISCFAQTSISSHGKQKDGR